MVRVINGIKYNMNVFVNNNVSEYSRYIRGAQVALHYTDFTL